MTTKITRAAVAALILVVSAPATTMAEPGGQLFLDGVLDALVTSDYSGDDLETPSSIALGRNYTFTCIEYRAAVLSNDRLLEGMAVGHALGVADALAQLHCFVGDARCRCLRDWPVGNPSRFGEAVGREVATCQRDRPAAGAIQEAIMNACR